MPSRSPGFQWTLEMIWQYNLLIFLFQCLPPTLAKGFPDPPLAPPSSRAVWDYLSRTLPPPISHCSSRNRLH